MKVGDRYINQFGEDLGNIFAIFLSGKYIMTCKTINTQVPFDHYTFMELSEAGEGLLVVGGPGAYRLSSRMGNRIQSMGKLDCLGLLNPFDIFTGHLGHLLDFCELVIELNEKWLSEQTETALQEALG